MSDSKIKIYISCHKRCYLPKQSFFYPIQVGAQIATERFDNMLHDDIGDNISEKNPMYCELTAQYWAWKHEEADYYGFFHYRRYMNFSDNILPHNPFEDAEINFLDDSALELLKLDEETVQRKVKQYDIIATTQVDLQKLVPPVKSNYEQYEITPYQYEEDIVVLLDIIKEKYPDYYQTANEYFKSNLGYFCNMFIMKREIFQEYSQWLFDILEEHEKRRDYHNYNIAGYRVSGYLGERLFGIWYTYQKKKGNYKCSELQRTLFKNVNEIKEVKPAYEENNISVALAANDVFVPYTATLIQSIVDNSKNINNYDIIILTQDISEGNKSRINQIIKGFNNFSIRYLDPTRLIEGYDFFVRGHFGLQTYYRLVLPELISDYDKIIYLDSDMIVNADIADLYNTDVNGYLVAACYDPDTAGLYNGYEKDKKLFMDTIMKLDSPYDYFQAGTLVLNLKEFRNTYSMEYILKFAVSQKWQLLDQDILNCLCKGRVKYIDMSWNVMVDFGCIRIKDIISLAPQWQYKMYMESRKNPKIIHYAGPEKPWTSPEQDMAEIFWHYAKETSFYEAMMYRMAHTVANHYYWQNRGFKNRCIQIKDAVLPFGTKRHAFVKRVFVKTLSIFRR